MSLFFTLLGNQNLKKLLKEMEEFSREKEEAKQELERSEAILKNSMTSSFI